MRTKALVIEASKHLSAIEPHIDRTLDLLEDWGGLGYPGGGDGGGRGGDDSSSTERAALSALERRERDRFATDRADLVEAIVAGEAAFAKARKIIAETKATPRDPATGKPVVAPKEGCAVCALVKDPTTGREHEQGHQRWKVRRPRPQSPDGPEVPVCSFHMEFWDRYGVEPAAAINLWHLEHLGNRIPRQMIQDHHPAEYSLYQSKLAGRPLGIANLALKTTEATP